MMPPHKRTRPPAAQSYTGATRLYVELAMILERYISAMQVPVVIDSALHRLDLRRLDVVPENLDKVIEQTGVGLRLFCEPERLPALMLELAALCDRCAA